MLNQRNLGKFFEHWLDLPAIRTNNSTNIFKGDLMKKSMIHCTVAIFLIWTHATMAQLAPSGSLWIQIEAQPERAAALQSMENYSTDFDNVLGFDIGAGWFGIALGPYQAGTADGVLQNLRQAGVIPRSSFITTGKSYRRQIYLTPATQADPVPSVAEFAILVPTPPAPAVPELQDPVTASLSTAEQRVQAFETEQAMTLAEKKYLQRALKWAGFYESAIDGLYGRGTRGAMARWQISKVYEDTGVLTATQRVELIADYQTLLAGLGFTKVTEPQAGISIQLPRALLGAAQYDAPFVRFQATTGRIAQVILISQTGDSARIKALYDVLQTLNILPKDGPRALNKSGFTIEGFDTERHTTGFARLHNGEIKGAILVWPMGDNARRQRVEDELFSSFTVLSGALPDAPLFRSGLLPTDLLGGLALRKPTFTQSGVFLNGEGNVLTAAQDFASCDMVELGDGTTLRVLAQNEQLAILEPEQEASPMFVPQFQTGPQRAPQHISVGGYAYGGKLGAPTLTLGLLQDLKNLEGDSDIARLEIKTLPGDIGGPVYSPTGAVIGILLPKPEIGAQQLPGTVNFAATWGLIEPLLLSSNTAVKSEETSSIMDIIDLAAMAQTTVTLVKCWD